jgi:hypothetical protein
MALNTIKVMFDGVLEECLVVETATEITCMTRDRRFVKFPPDVDIKAAVTEHNKANGDKPMLAEEVEAVNAELNAWFNG